MIPIVRDGSAQNFKLERLAHFLINLILTIKVKIRESLTGMGCEFKVHV